MNNDKLPIISQLEEAAGRKDYFLLRDLYARHRDSLPEKEGLYWDAIIYNLSGREYLSTVAAGKFLERYGEEGEQAAEMLYLTAVNRLRRFRYPATAATFRKLLRLHRDRMDAEELEEAESTLSVCRALRKVPPQTMSLNGIDRIPTRRTTFGHISVTVEAGEHRGNFIVDTGANFSTVGLTAARAMGLVPATSGVEVGTATGVRLECGLSHAPQLDLAGITVRNAVFIVMEDDQLSFPEIGYSIEGIIGLPVLRQLGDLRFSRDHIRIGNVRIPSGLRDNILFEGLMPLAEVGVHGERLMFTLDTGANQSEYSFGYYQKNTERLEYDGKLTKGLRGGGGGVIRHRSIVLRDETLSIAGREVTIPAMNAIRDDYEFSRGKDGNLGLDALMSGDGFAISFSRMALYLYTKKKAGRKKVRKAMSE